MAGVCESSTMPIVFLNHSFQLLYSTEIVTKSFYTNYQNRLTNLIRQSKRNFYLLKFNQYQNDTEKTWKLIKNTLKPNTGTKYSNSFSLNSEQFNDYFSTVGEKLKNKIDSINTNYSTYLNNSINNSIFLNNSTPKEVVEVIKSLKIKKEILEMYLHNLSN